MKIILYTLNFKPEKVGIGKYSGELADYLYQEGHEIRVICAPEYYPKWEVYNNRFLIENKKIYSIYRCPIYVPKVPNGIKRILHLMSFSISSLLILLFQLSWKPDLIIVVAPSILSALNVFLYQIFSLKKIFYLLHIQDFEFDIAFRLKLLKGKFFKNIFSKIELLIYEKFDIVSSISKGMLEKLILKGLDKKKVFYFPNWVNTKEIRRKKINDKNINIYRRNFQIPSNKIIIQYSGSMNQKQGLEILLPIIENFKDNENILWLFSGEGPTKNQFISATRDISNIKFLPLQNTKNMNDWLNAGDIHIIPQRETVDGLLFPSKLLAILASGNPIISNAFEKSELGEIVGKVGIRVNPNDEIGFINALNILIENEEYRLNLGKKARKIAVKEYSKKKVLNSFNKFIENKVNNLD